MKSRLHCFFPCFLIFLLSGCAHVISKDLRANADPSLTFSQAHQNPNSYKGKSVVWGGEIIETVNQKDGTTQIEVIQRPLGWREEPKEALASEGRFLILVRNIWTLTSFGEEGRSPWPVNFLERRSNLWVRWIIDILFF